MHSPSYLLELMDPKTGGLEDADVFARFDTAVEKAYFYVKSLSLQGVRAEVSLNKEGEVDGFGFFDAEQQLLACVTVYRLEFDSEEPILDAVKTSFAEGPKALEQTLNSFLSR